MRLAEIARRVAGTLDGDGDVEIRGVSSIEEAAPGTLTFLADARHAAKLDGTRAAAVLVTPDAPAPPIPAVRVADPYAAFVAVVDVFHPRERPAPGVHASAVVAPSARIGARAHVGPHVVIGEGVVVGDDAVLHAGVVLYPRVRAGDRFTAHARVVVREDVRIGHGVTLHAGAVVGSDGFGYLPGPDGIRKIPQVGTVVIEDEVEVGAGSTIDRAAIDATVIGRGTKIDNLVMIGHGCRIGPYCLLAGQVGLAGGTTLGAGVMMGGQAGSAGHLSIGDGARIGAQAGMHRDIPAGGTYSGYPAMELRRWRRVTMALPKLPELVRRLRRVERKVGLGGDDDGE